MQRKSIVRIKKKLRKLQEGVGGVDSWLGDRVTTVLLAKFPVNEGIVRIPEPCIICKGPI